MLYGYTDIVPSCGVCRSMCSELCPAAAGMCACRGGESFLSLGGGGGGG